jgi:hypothetical protein
MVRTDRPGQDPADIDFMDMPPGWHVTTGPAAILWNPSHTASGEFRLEMESYLFDPRGRREGFGVFLGGRDLEGADQEYVYFLLREGNEFLVKRRRGDVTEVVVDWSPAPSMVSYAGKAEDEATAMNVLAVEAGDETVRFLVNGEEVASLPRGSLSLDGVVGLRVNHALNLHVTRLDVETEGDPPQDVPAGDTPDRPEP